MFKDGTSRNPSQCGPERFYTGPLPWEEDDRWRACSEDEEALRVCEEAPREPGGFLWRLSRLIFCRRQSR
jgi:hypothetical protein